METQTKTPSYQDGLTQLRENLGGMLPPEALAKFDTDAEQLQQTHQDILKLKKGDKAPDFTLVNVSGDQVSLATILQKRKAIVVFYRGTWCPYCNLQLAQYAQLNDEINQLVLP